jgi:hypothetical protein
MKFRKKPVVIDAMQFVYSTDGIKSLSEFCGSSLVSVGKDRHAGAVGWAQIGILEDGTHGQAKHIATEGDWIIRGAFGDFYPCKPNFFEDTYESL